MPQRKLRRALPLLGILLATAGFAACAGASALVETHEIRLKLNADFQPRDLPVHSFAPVRLRATSTSPSRAAASRPRCNR